MDDRPLAFDLFSGLGGWAKGLIANGWRVIGVDIEDMFAAVGVPKPEHYELWIRDVLTIHGAELAAADLIVSSSPCTEYSYMAMPWSLAKAKAAAIRADETGDALIKLNALFEAQFRIQREASAAKGEHIPMVVENVRGAQPWVGPAAWSYGSFYLWGDVPALMPSPHRDARKANPDGTNHGTGSWFAIADSKDRGASGRKNPGFRFDGSGKSFQTESVERHVLEGRKNGGGSWFKIGSPGQTVTGQNPDGRNWARDPVASCSSKGSKRKAASAKIAEIPEVLASHIARVYLPKREVA